MRAARSSLVMAADTLISAGMDSFSMFTAASGFQTAWVMLGAVLAEVLQIGVIGFLFSRLARPLEWLRPVRVAAALLVVTGLAWFALRLKG